MAITAAWFNGQQSNGVKLNLEVIQDDSDVLLTLSNQSTNDATVTSVFFESDFGPTITIQNTTGILVDFSRDDSINLPGWNVIAWKRDQDVAFDAGNPSPFKGLNPSESITFRLTNKTVETISGEQIAMHVQQLENGGSGSYRFTEIPTNIPVPEPTSAILIGATAMLALLRRNRCK